MDRTAVFVDAGYFYKAAGTLLTGRNLTRSEVHLDFSKGRDLLEALALKASGLPLLRIYWYDGAKGGPSPQHNALAYLPNVKLRLGFINNAGEQKGVDSLLVLDLINLARNHAMADAVLVTGDEDLRVGVLQAQEFGIRVHLVGVEPVQQNQSSLLRQEADSLHEITKAEIESIFSVSALHPANDLESLPMAKLEDIAVRFLASLPQKQRQRLPRGGQGGIPKDIDRELLATARKALSRVLTIQECAMLRSQLIKLAT